MTHPRHLVTSTGLGTLVQRLIFDSKRWVFVCVLMLVSLFRTGIWGRPDNVSLRLMAVDPFTTAPVGYLGTSWLLPLLAWVLHATSAKRFFVLCLVFTVLFTVTVIVAVFHRFDERRARIALLVFFMLPISGAVWLWVGADGFTVLLMLGAVLAAKRLPIVLGLGVLLGMQHFEQGAFAIGALLLAALLSRDEITGPLLGRRFSIVWLAGLGVGRLLLALVFHLAGIVPGQSRFGFLIEHMSDMVYSFWIASPYILASTFGLGWVLVALYLRTRRQAVAFLFPIAILVLLIVVTGDETRVFATSSFPLLLATWILNPDFLDQVSDALAKILLIAWAATPYLWVWGGLIRLGTAPYDVLYVGLYFGAVYPPGITWPFGVMLPGYPP